MANAEHKFPCLYEGCQESFTNSFSQQAHLLMEHFVFKPLCNSSVDLENYKNQEGLRNQFSSIHNTLRVLYRGNTNIERKLEALEKMAKVCDKILEYGMATNIEIPDSRITKFYSEDRRLKLDKDSFFADRIHDILWVEASQKVLKVMQIGKTYRQTHKTYPKYKPYSQLTEEQREKRRAYYRRKSRIISAQTKARKELRNRISACMTVDLEMLSNFTEQSMKEYKHWENHVQSRNVGT